MSKKKRVAISLEMDFGYKRHLEAYAGCQAYADEAGWECTIHPAVDRVLEPRQGKNGFDGVLARVTPALAEAARRSQVPVVNTWMNSPVKDLPNVFPDFKSAGVMAGEHLLGRGFRQFGYMGFQREVDARQQQEGFSGCVRGAGFPCSSLRFSRIGLEWSAPAWEKFSAELATWIEQWELPIGVFVVHDLYCRYLIDACRSKGLHVSQDVAIVSCGNEPDICRAPSPSLTSIDMGYGEIGYRAAELLDRLMDGSTPPAEPILVPPVELVSRQSTDAFASDDPLVARAMRFIAEHSNQPMQVKDVAAAVATTRRTLERRFRGTLDKTIAEEIARLRVERAKRRLVESDDSMKAVAKDAGFRNADHFYKVFTRVEDMPPSQYRDQHQPAFLKRGLVSGG